MNSPAKAVTGNWKTHLKEFPGFSGNNSENKQKDGKLLIVKKFFVIPTAYLLHLQVQICARLMNGINLGVVDGFQKCFYAKMSYVTNQKIIVFSVLDFFSRQ